MNTAYESTPFNLNCLLSPTLERVGFFMQLDQALNVLFTTKEEQKRRRKWIHKIPLTLLIVANTGKCGLSK